MFPGGCRPGICPGTGASALSAEGMPGNIHAEELRKLVRGTDPQHRTHVKLAELIRSTDPRYSAIQAQTQSSDDADLLVPLRFQEPWVDSGELDVDSDIVL